MDFRLPDVTGPDAARTIKSAHADAAIVFHSADESETALLDAIDAGATAYLTKDATADQIVEAVRRASTGEVLIPVELFARASWTSCTCSPKDSTPRRCRGGSESLPTPSSGTSGT
jgi:DNA-binding NarL/FixJ family response regulator